VTENTQENSIETPVYQLEIPNIITPNGDGFNDVLIIKNLDKYADNNLLIADRAGKLVYEKNSYRNDWDAQNVPDGTYYYVISYKDKNNSKGVIKGLITILRK
jgi:gliding motility-associated-like protein